MTWGLVFRIRQELKGSLSVIPVLGGVVGFVLGVSNGWLEGAVETPSSWEYSSDTALTVLTTIVAATVSLTGFVVTVTILVVQMSTGTFSARYMRIWYRDPVLKAVLAVLVGTFTYSFSLLRRVEGDTVPHLGITMAGLFLGAGLVLFIVFLDRVIHRLRPVKVAFVVARAGRASIQEVAAVSTRPGQKATDVELRELRAAEPSFVVCSERAGAIQAFDERGLVGWAGRNGCVLVLLHATGDSVSTGARMLEVYGNPRLPAVAKRQLGGMVALGTERTIDQDPAFALRIMVDVAIRALSPAINDPTTAVQVLNQVEDTLSTIGSTSGLDGRWEFRDDAGHLRLVMPARRWEDFLTVGATEIRVYGANAIQVVRRLRGMLETLQQTVLPEYRAAVDDELRRLDATVAEHWGTSVDHDRAMASDRQGIGEPPRLGR